LGRAEGVACQTGVESNMARKHLATSARALEVSSHGPVTLRIVQAGLDQTVVELGVDYRQAEVPERFYSADYCEIQKARAGLSLFFGKLIPGTSKLRTKIEVTFPEEMFLRQLWASSRDFHKTVQGVAEKIDFPPLENVEDTDKVQTFRSNNVFMGMWGEESVMDFYYLSPRDIHFAKTQQRGAAALEPVVRVVLSTALMFEFLEKCRHHVERLSAAVEVPQSGVN
jgi:hypothetical protein